LGQLARVKLGFFDEPTTNLDVERRGNLAQIIPRITGDFDQLFVISHDDSFDAMTDNIIQLQKDQGEGTKLA
jgi:exonuclease SbcC